MLHHAITEFGRRLGLPDLCLSHDGYAALNVQGLGCLYLEHVRDEAASMGPRLLLCLVRPLPPHEARLRRKALEICHYSHAHPLPLAAGMRGDDLVLFSWLAGGELHGAALENAVRFLAGMADKIFAD